MTFSAYVDRQKSLIRSRRATEKSDAESTRERLLKELASFKGLNTPERLLYNDKYVFSKA